MLAVLGSVALNNYQFVRKPVDLDLLGTYDDVTAYVEKLKRTEKILAHYPIDSGRKIVIKTDKRIVEAEIAWPDSDSEALLKIIEDDQYTFNKNGVLIPTLNVLYTLKMSHRYRKDSPHFLKTMNDILLMRELGAKIPEQYQEWYGWRQRETYQNHLPKLNVSKKDFFDNSSGIYTLQHDDIHLAVKHLDKPAYEYFKPDAAEVYTSKELFFKCSREVQLYSVLEEVMTLSLERSIHPFPSVNRRWAFNTAHQKLASSISSGFYREFVWENYHTVQDMYDEKYIDKFYEALHNGQIRKFGSEEPFKEAA